MNDPSGVAMTWPVALMFQAMLAGGAIVWIAIARRLMRRESVVAYEPRRRVPWQGIDLILVVLVYVCVMSLAVTIDASAFHVNFAVAPQVDQAKSDANHALVVLLREDRSLPALALCLISGAIVAPIAEEIFFRLLLQGWLEAIEPLYRRRVLGLRRIARGLRPVAISSAIFAILHFRTASPQADPRLLLHGFAIAAVANALTVVFAISFVRLRVGATWADLGLRPERFWTDVRLGLCTFLAIAVPIYALQGLLEAVLPKDLAPDPITLWFFAFVLGTIYYRTHRIVPSIVVHMALNATSLAMAWFSL